MHRHSKILALGILAATLLLASCRHYDDFEIAGTVIEQEYCTSMQNRGYAVALSSPTGIGGSYTNDSGDTYDNVVIIYKADRILKKNASITGRIYIDNNFSAAECSYHYDRDCPEAVFTKLSVL